ncbi:MAG TPA: farnesyl diphosphate synthase [Acidobacteriota bacterium]|nr:farnesyl diphosphate synthase [Acidobacteriota bacterium]
MVEPEQSIAGPTFDLQDFVAQERARVDTALQVLLPAAEHEPRSLHHAMRHSVFAGGKRIRPLLAIAAGRACHAEPEDVLGAACAIELIHTYSLIHDDLPAFDEEELRRGEPTCHVLFGDAIAILAGDALQALAFETMASAARDATNSHGWVVATQRVAAAAGSIGMCGGQTLDLEATGQSIDLSALRRLHAAKTGALLTASVVCGGLIAGASSAECEALERYGQSIGLAFQVVDDLLDVEGDIRELGKQPGSDAARGQPTFPALIGIDAARTEAIGLRDTSIEAVERFGPDGDALRGLARMIIDRTS